MFVACAKSFFLLFRGIREDAVDDGEDETECERPPETIYFEAGGKEIYQLDDEGVDDEEKQAQRYDGDWNC